MTFRGHIENGVAVFDEPVELPDGTAVRIELEETSQRRTLADRLRDVIGAAEGLPSDLAEQHDHYLHGKPKK
jgi:hypothetical protein